MLGLFQDDVITKRMKDLKELSRDVLAITEKSSMKMVLFLIVKSKWMRAWAQALFFMCRESMNLYH